MNNLKQIIPVFRELLIESGLESKNVINANSYFRSDVSFIDNDGYKLDGREKNINNDFCIFDLSVNKILNNESNKNFINILYNAKLEIDIYGDNANEISLNFNSILLSEMTILKLINKNIGINPNIEINIMYETINNVQWLRSNIVLYFTYNYKYEKTDGEYIESYELNMEGKNLND